MSRMPVVNGGGIPPSQLQPQVEQLSLGERVLIGATPIVTVGSLIGLGYPPYSALLRWRICEHMVYSHCIVLRLTWSLTCLIDHVERKGHNPKDAPNKMSWWKVLKTVKQKDGVKGLYKGRF